MEQREQFIEDVRCDRMSTIELCAHYGVSRKTGYKWIVRAREEGRRGLADRSRAPHHCPHKVTDEMATLLCALRVKHDDWGARKLLRVLQTRHPRFLLACHARPSTQTRTAWPIFEWAFREYGLPRAIRSDNGAPFATVGLHGLSRLSVWWLKLGIPHQRITPGTPSENGAHERMHRSLKRRAIRPARATMAAQQRTFNAFRAEFNEVRPHEALGMETPASRYASSPRAYPSRILAPEYPGHFLVKGVTTGGTFRFHNRLLYLANALSGERVGLDEVDDGVWHIYFGAVLIATLDEREYIIRECLPSVTHVAGLKCHLCTRTVPIVRITWACAAADHIDCGRAAAATSARLGCCSTFVDTMS